MKNTGGLSIMKLALSLVLLLSGLLFYGCGVGGGTSATSDSSNSASNPGGGPPSGPDSSFTINLRSAVTPTSANKVRVAIRKWQDITTTQQVCTAYDDNGVGTDCTDQQVTNKTLVWQDIQDTDYGSQITVGIPADDNYSLDVITYSNEVSGPTTINRIVSYGTRTGITVTAGATNIVNVSMRTASEILSMTAPTSVTSRGTFDVTLNNGLPFAPSYKMTMSINGSEVDSKGPTPANKLIFTVPDIYTAATASLVGEFTLDRSFLKQGESQTQWTYGEKVEAAVIPLVSVVVGF